MAAEKTIANDQRDPSQTDGPDRRRAPRVLVNLEVDFASQDNFLFAYIKDISATGIFVRTDAPEAPGTRLNLRFRNPDDRDQILDLEGEVIWVNPYRPGNADSLNPGMGIRFVDLDQDDRLTLRMLVKTFAFLDD
jgi:uncharacterized protein (TIGR02266 family)